MSGDVTEGIEFVDDPNTNDPTEDNTVEGNLIGANAAGDAAIPNGDEGIEMVDANHNDDRRQRDLGQRRQRRADPAQDTTTADATRSRQRDRHRRRPARSTSATAEPACASRINTPDENGVGTTNVADPMNTIAFNGEDGVALDGGTRTAMLRNAIFANDGLGIDLDNNDATLNDAGDGDTGANGLLNFPEITGATATASTGSSSTASPTRRSDSSSTRTTPATASGTAKARGSSAPSPLAQTEAGTSPTARRSPPPPANL